MVDLYELLALTNVKALWLTFITAAVSNYNNDSFTSRKDILHASELKSIKINLQLTCLLFTIQQTAQSRGHD